MAALGSCVMAFALVACAFTNSVWLFSAGFALWAVAGGLTAGVAQMALMAAHPDARERMMTRWTLFGTIGDASAPFIALVVVALGGNFRIALLVAASFHIVSACLLALASRDLGADDDEGDEEGSGEALWKRLLSALRDPALLIWLGAAALCTLLDEILVAFGTLHMRDVLDASALEQSLFVFTDAIGCAVGLVITDRLITRVHPWKILVASGCVCAVAYVAWLSTPSSTVAVVAMFFVGLGCAPLYPLTIARAYATRPDSPGVVAAADTLWSPIAVFAPLVLGFVAQHFSLATALALLLAQPLGIAVLAAILRDGSARRAAG
jgi:Na+/melibiose symporter-like transporter